VRRGGLLQRPPAARAAAVATPRPAPARRPHCACNVPTGGSARPRRARDGSGPLPPAPSSPAPPPRVLHPSLGPPPTAPRARRRQIRVDFTKGGPFEAHLASCPDPAEPLAPGGGGAPEDPAVASVVLRSPALPDSLQMKELLVWFQTAAGGGAPGAPDGNGNGDGAPPAGGGAGGDTRAALSLPPTVSKHQRALWHKAAERLGLHSESSVRAARRRRRAVPACLAPAPRPSAGSSRLPPRLLGPPRPRRARLALARARALALSIRAHSLPHPDRPQGVGDERHLDIYAEAAWQRLLAEGAVGNAAAPPAAAAASGGAAQRAERELKQRAKQLWGWCQREGLFNYSQGGWL
jgi:hypothetical protein